MNREYKLVEKVLNKFLNSKYIYLESKKIINRIKKEIYLKKFNITYG